MWLIYSDLSDSNEKVITKNPTYFECEMGGVLYDNYFIVLRCAD